MFSNGDEDIWTYVPTSEVWFLNAFKMDFDTNEIHERAL